MRRVVCWLRGHDWWNRTVVYKGGTSQTTYKTLSVRFEDDSGVTERSGVFDFCFRCGKEKWRPTSPLRGAGSAHRHTGRGQNPVAPPRRGRLS